MYVINEEILGLIANGNQLKHIKNMFFKVMKGGGNDKKGGGKAKKNIAIHTKIRLH
jgi:hypothetical protein